MLVRMLKARPAMLTMLNQCRNNVKRTGEDAPLYRPAFNRPSVEVFLLCLRSGIHETERLVNAS